MPTHLLIEFGVAPAEPIPASRQCRRITPATSTHQTNSSASWLPTATRQPRQLCSRLTRDCLQLDTAMLYRALPPRSAPASRDEVDAMFIIGSKIAATVPSPPRCCAPMPPSDSRFPPHFAHKMIKGLTAASG